jgi:hypothetical protein
MSGICGIIHRQKDREVDKNILYSLNNTFFTQRHIQKISNDEEKFEDCIVTLPDCMSVMVIVIL